MAITKAFTDAVASHRCICPAAAVGEDGASEGRLFCTDSLDYCNLSGMGIVPGAGSKDEICKSGQGSFPFSVGADICSGQ